MTDLPEKAFCRYSSGMNPSIGYWLLIPPSHTTQLCGKTAWLTRIEFQLQIRTQHSKYHKQNLMSSYKHHVSYSIMKCCCILNYKMTKSQVVSTKPIYILDLHFMKIPGTIATYLIPHSHGAVLIESGPGSTISALRSELSIHNLRETDITDVLLTHIHLDHAGAAGWLARQGAHIYVHHVGAPHMVNPEKLLESARRIYGDQMDALWGEFLPVPEKQLSSLQDEDVIEIDHLRFRALDTPGHANHHMAYIFEDICFSGDVGGVRLTGPRHLRLPMPPPEFHIEKWRASMKRLFQEYEQGSFSMIAPTHFGIYSDADWHLAALSKVIDEVENWMEKTMPADPPIEELEEIFTEWARQRSLAAGIGLEQIQAYEAANPSWMSPFGIQRYWRKYRSQSNDT
jgi:glyoxylase-like metal-dependent hydrolase (beta-lactamase superfamily II)